MPITVTCRCGRVLQAPDSEAGKTALCPACSATVLVTQTGTAASSPPPEPVTPPSVPLPDLSHAGYPLKPDLKFFVDPPTEIGTLLSADSTLLQGQVPMTNAVRWVMSVLFGVVVGAIAGAGVSVYARGLNDNVYLTMALTTPAVIGLSYACIRFSHRCTFVGTDGVATFDCSGSIDRVSERLLRFDDAVELRVSRTRNYHTSALGTDYLGTSYHYYWTNKRNETLFSLRGGYKSEADEPPPDNEYYLAVAAESAWTDHLSRNLDRVMGKGRSIRFGLSRNDCIRLSPTELEITIGGRKASLDARDIECVEIVNGRVSVREVGGKRGWFSNKGIHDFPYEDLGNAQFFLYAVQQVLRVPIR